MKNLISLALILICSACSLPKDVEPIQETDELAAFKALVAEKMDAEEDIKGWKIVWFDSYQDVTDLHGFTFKGECIRGFTDFKNATIYTTPDALGHEFKHVQLYNKTKGLASGHSHTELTGWDKDIEKEIDDLEKELYFDLPFVPSLCEVMR